MNYGIRVTTTSNFEGYKIKKYYDAISDHVVVGSNVFSDNMAAWTDFFGGYSETYQKKLSLIKNKAIKNLQQSARYLGANAIVGLKIDVDQLTGKNMSMFMVTLIGTPVLIEQEIDSQDIIINEYETQISSSEIDLMIQKKKIKLELKNQPNTPITNEKWEFIIENKFWEICQELISCAVEWNKSLESGLSNKIKEYVKIYLFNLDKSQITNLLYTLYLDDKYRIFHKMILEIMNEKGISDLNQLLELTSKINESQKEKVLKLITVRKEITTESDIKLYKILAEQIKINFKEIVEYSKQKKMFSSTEEVIWICKCKNKNPIDIKYCSNCNNDKYGFVRDSVNPPIAIDWINETIETFLELNTSNFSKQ